MIIDFHTHAFPDSLAERAILELEKECDVKAFLDGRISSLLRSMDNAKIEKSVICSIATKPSQFRPILDWSKNIRSDRIIPLPSIHPNDPDISENIKIIYNEGFKGIKLHPYYQDFILDDESLFPLYEALQKYELLLVSHTGFDIAFPKKRIADPVKIINVTKNFPELKFVATHLGGWEDWDEVEKHLIGKPIYFEISFSLEILQKQRAKKLLLDHSSDLILFGTDSPWTDQQKSLDLLYSLELEKEIEEKILYKNAINILKL